MEERLKEIEENIKAIQLDYDVTGYVSTNTADDLIVYCGSLISKVKEQQNEIEKLKTEWNIDAAKRTVQIGGLLNKIERYESALHAILGLALEDSADGYVDIVTDSLSGHGLHELYIRYAEEGKVTMNEILRERTIEGEPNE